MLYYLMPFRDYIYKIQLQFYPAFHNTIILIRGIIFIFSHECIGKLAPNFNHDLLALILSP